MFIHRNVTVEDCSYPKQCQFGIKATTQFGLDTLRANAIAKMAPT